MKWVVSYHLFNYLQPDENFTYYEDAERFVKNLLERHGQGNVKFLIEEIKSPLRREGLKRSLSRV